jgi:hypothetical protein
MNETPYGSNGVVAQGTMGNEDVRKPLGKRGPNRLNDNDTRRRWRISKASCRGARSSGSLPQCTPQVAESRGLNLWR